MINPLIAVNRAALRVILQAVQAMDPSAVILGGALRDLHFGKPVKDVDVFVGPDFDPVKAQRHLPANWMLFSENRADHSIEYEDFFEDTLKGIYEMGVPDFPATVQIISMGRDMTVFEHFARFDLDFCRFAMISENITIQGEMPDAPRIVHFTGGEGHLGRNAAVQEAISQSRAHRLSEKYPDTIFRYPTRDISLTKGDDFSF